MGLGGGFGWAGPYFWDELPGRLPLLVKRFRAMGGPSCKRSTRAISTLDPKLLVLVSAS